MERTSWEHDEVDVSGTDSYEMLKCCGCDRIKLRHTSTFSEADEENVSYFPPAIFRRRPDWFYQLPHERAVKDGFVRALLEEIYVALQNDLPTLATMGVRSLLEKIMISRIGDNGTFGKNLGEFEKSGHVSTLQRERLETILEVGHAAMHRVYTPKIKDVVMLLDITEHIVESVFLHDSKIDELKKRVPARVKGKDGK